MQGTGNDILVVDNRGAIARVPSAGEIRELGNPESGPGFDQMMWLESSPVAAAAYRVFNADGGEVEQCGNGLRCVAWYLGRDGLDELTLSSPAGHLDARLESDGSVSVSMGPPIFEPSKIPFVAEREALTYDIDVDGIDMTISAVSMGNPHAVVDVDSTADAPVSRVGPILERHERFPKRANVGFMAIRDRGHIDLRVFERGVGETLACGTGACAAVVSGSRRGLLDDRVSVRLPGGELVVSWRGDDVWLTGTVTLIKEGRLTL
jgi:diaminopimelate epimerase